MYNTRPSKSHNLVLRLTVLTRMLRSHVRYKILWLVVFTMHHKEGFTFMVSLRDHRNLLGKASSSANAKD